VVICLEGGGRIPVHRPYVGACVYIHNFISTEAYLWIWNIEFMTFSRVIITKKQVVGYSSVLKTLKKHVALAAHVFG